MGNSKFFEIAIDKRLLDLHCGYIGKVIWTDGNTATVQPLGMIKQAGESAGKAQAVVSNVPVACKYKLVAKDITYVTGVSGSSESVSASTATQTVAVPQLIAAGDLVACLCADRDITDARQGKNSVPVAGMHSISDSIIVGIL